MIVKNVGREMAAKINFPVGKITEIIFSFDVIYVQSTLSTRNLHQKSTNFCHWINEENFAKLQIGSNEKKSFY